MNNRIEKIAKNLKEYTKSIYSVKNTIIWKIILFLTISIVIIMPFFVIRDVMLNMKTLNYNFMGNFVEGYITSNTGLGLSSLNNNVAGAYTLQTIFSIFPLFLFIFSKNKLLDAGSLFMFFGGFSNLIDRMTYDNFKYLLNYEGIIPENAVVDYWRFGFVNNSFIFNYADVFIILGAIFVCLSFVFIFIKKIKEEENEKENKKNEKNKI